jgi:hypothetical protein
MAKSRMIKFCYKCQKNKSFSEFGKDKSRIDGLSNICKSCRNKIYQINCLDLKFKSKERKMKNKYYIKNKYKFLLKAKKYYKKNKDKVSLYNISPQRIYRLLEKESKRRKIEFNLLTNDFITWYVNQPKICIYCKRIESEALKDCNNKYKRLSIDRKNNNEGYSLNNIGLACYRCNTMKGEIFTYNEMIEIGKFSEEILSKRKNRYEYRR